MKVKKAIKKIAAIGMGATMLGATMLGASAQDLSQYPDMFLENGQFNGLLVVGENADSVDTIGMTNVMAGLQAAAVSTTTVCPDNAAGGGTSVEEGVQISRSGDDVNLGDNLADVFNSDLDETDLPDVLAEGNYDENEGDNDNDVDYTQTLTLGGQFVYTENAESSDEEADFYLFFDDNADAYVYELEFDTAVDFDGAADLESTTIEIQGQVYTITDVTLSGDQIDEMKLLVGDTLRWMTQDQTIVQTIDGVEHTITMLDVTVGADACGFEVDGATVWIDVDDTETVNGVTLGVTDAKAVHTETYDADICKVSLGAMELTLEDGQDVEIDGNQIEESTVTFSQTDNRWTGFTIAWNPVDSIYAEVGDSVLDPVFGNFKYVFADVVVSYEEIDVSMSDSSGSLTFMNLDGDEVEIPFAEDGGSFYLGDGAEIDEQVYLGAEAADDPSLANACTYSIDGAAGDIEDCDGARWLVSVSGEAHVLELDINEDSSGNYDLELNDLTTGNSDDENDVGPGNNTATLSVPGIGDMVVTWSTLGNYTGDVTPTDNESYIRVESPDALTTIETEEGMTFTTMTYNIGTNLSVVLTEEVESDITNDEATVGFTINLDADDDLEIGTGPTVLPASVLADADGIAPEKDSDDVIYVTEYGTHVLFDGDDSQSLVISYPEEVVIAEVFVSPAGAAVIPGVGSGCYEMTEVNKIPSSVNKFDTEVSNVGAQNLISIGGPCANSVSSALLGNPEVCYEGFEAGRALLKLVESGDNVALVVAGGIGADTRIASTVLQDYEDYEGDLAGMELWLTTVSENNIGFEAVEEE